MIIYIIGHKRWIGQKYLSLFKQNKNIKVFYSDLRAEDDKLKEYILENKCTHVLFCAGRTHGNI